MIMAETALHVVGAKLVFARGVSRPVETWPRRFLCMAMSRRGRAHAAGEDELRPYNVHGPPNAVSHQNANARLIKGTHRREDA